MTDCKDNCGVGAEPGSTQERRILIVVLIINAAMFVAEFSAGLNAGSTALLADSLDMLADALIYGLGLYALGRAMHWRARAALSSGVLQLALGVVIAIEATTKMFAGSLPDTGTMGVFGVLALIANLICFVLLTRFRDGDINLRATWICSRNDIIGNIGVLIAAGLVSLFDQSWPDIVIGLVIAVIVIQSAWKVAVEARQALKQEA